VPETHIDVTVFKGRISVRYDRIGHSRRYLLVRAKETDNYFALEIDSCTERLAKQEKAREELVQYKESVHEIVAQPKKCDLIPDAPGGKTVFGGKGFKIELRSVF